MSSSVILIVEVWFVAHRYAVAPLSETTARYARGQIDWGRVNGSVG